MFCGKCGSKIEDGAKFCPSCGAGCGAAKEHVVSVDNKKEKSKKKWKKSIIAVIVVVLVVLLIGLVVWLMKQKPVEEGNPADAKQTENAESNVVNTEEEEQGPKIKTEAAYNGAELWYKYEYDIRGNRIYEEYGDYNYKYEYDEYGHVTYSYYEDSDGSYSVIEWNYDNDRLISISAKEYSKDGYLEDEQQNTFFEEDNLLKAYMYDDTGVMTGEVHYTLDGKLVYSGDEDSYTKIEYDKNGKVIEEIRSTGSSLNQRTYEYDSDSKLVKSTFDYSGESGGESYYAQNGMLTESKSYDEWGEEITTYNKYGDPIRTREYDTEGNSDGTSEYEYKYDDYGNKTECHYISYDKNDEIIYESWDYYEYVYDEDGNILEQYEYDEDGTLRYNYHYTYY